MATAIAFQLHFRTKVEHCPIPAKKERAAKLPILAAFYYLDHFTETLDFVRRTYGLILTEEHRAFIAVSRVYRETPVVC